MALEARRRVKEYGVGAQILLDLGIRDMILLTDTPEKKIVALDGYGLNIVGTHAIRGRKDTMPSEVTETTFEQEVLSGEGKVIVDFWAEWCGPCHAVAPVLDRIADDHSLRIVKVNIDEEQSLAQRYGVASIPMMILFENGEPQASAVGAMPKGVLERQLGLSEGD